MTETLQPPTPAKKSRQLLRQPRSLAGLAVMVLAVVGVVAFFSRGGDDGPRYPVVKMTPVDHEVIYEVNGTGSIPVLSWIVGADNKEVTAQNVPLPWKQTVTIPVGPAGGHANVEVIPAQTGTGSTSCTMFVDGVQVDQKTSSDGFAGVACSAVIPPTYVK